MDTLSNLCFQTHYIIVKTHGTLVVYKRRKCILCKLYCNVWTQNAMNFLL